MGKKLVSRTAKVLSETKKSKDKEAIAIAYEHIPRNPEEQRHGAIYAVIEIEDASGHAESLADSILDALHNEYYMDNDRDSLASFEAALAKVNEELAERSSEGQINWLGKLNAVLGVLSDNTLHLSQAGKAEAFLYRGEQSIHVSEGLSGDSINPLRTFINVASGDLTENDRLVFVTPGIFLKVSKNELKRYVVESSPKFAVENLSRILSGDNTHALPNAALILDMVSPEALANEPEPDVSSEAWVKPQNNHLEPVGETTVRGTAKVFDLLGKAANGATTFIGVKVVPVVKKAAKKIQSKIKGFSEEKEAEKIILEDEREDFNAISENLDLPETQNPEVPAEEVKLDQNEAPGVNEFRIREEKKPKRLSIERFDFSFGTKLKHWFSRGTHAMRLPQSKNRRYFLIGAIALCFVIVIAIVMNANAAKLREGTETKYAQAKFKYEEALTELAAGRKQNASEDLTAASNLAVEVKNSKYQISEIDKLISDIENTKNQIEGIIKNTAQEFFDFGKGELNALYSDGKIYYVLKNETGSVYALDPTAKTMATIIENPEIDGKIKFSTYIESRKVIVVYTDAKVIYEIDLAGKKVTKQTVSGTLEDGLAMASFNSNIYILSAIDNEIFKHIKIVGGYGQKTAYFAASENPSITAAKDLAIDSNVYILQGDGTVEKYTAGKKQTFALMGMPSGATGLEKIYAGVGLADLYLYAKNRIIRIDENQNFSAQYLSDGVDNITSILASDDSSKIMALSNGKIYSISY